MLLAAGILVAAGLAAIFAIPVAITLAGWIRDAIKDALRAPSATFADVDGGAV